MNRFDENQFFLTRLHTMNFEDNDEPRRAIEYESDDQKLAPSLSGDLSLNANDVLCGRGKTSFNHVGNRRFRHIISESIDDYNSAGSRKAKSAVVKKVHDIIRATGGRFLKLDSSQRMWVELTQQRSLEKVSHAIRDATSTNENMKKKKEKVHKTIAQVAAHVTSRFPTVHLEGKLDHDDDDDTHELLAFKSVESLHMSMPALPDARVDANLGDASSSRSEDGRLESAEEETPMPPLIHPSSQGQGSLEERMPPLLTSSTKLQFPEEDAPQIMHQRHRRPHQPVGSEEEPTLAPHHSQHQQDAHRQPEDDFVSYINEVLGPVSPTDLDVDPLKKLARRKKRERGIDP